MVRRVRRGARGAAKMGAVSLLVAAMGAGLGGPFTKGLPEPLPSLEGWEKISGEAEMDRPRMTVQYEFFVNPQRAALYEVVRYRITYTDRGPDEIDSSNEKLQWDAGRRKLRRFECREQHPAGGPCRWEEMAPGSPAYEREMPVLLWLYDLHRRLLAERDRSLPSPP